MFFAGFKYLGIFRRHRGLHGGGPDCAGGGLCCWKERFRPCRLFTAVLVMIFGGLTLYLKNDVFIKMKPTVLYAFFGADPAGRAWFQSAVHQICFRPSL